jgi:signal transduction histidine kinase
MREPVVQELHRAGIAADAVGRASEAQACLAQVRDAALVLGRGLPDGDALPWLQRLCARQVLLPCLMLTARDALHDRIDGLEAGADDYLAKPFERDELVASVRALLRRQSAWVVSAPQWAGLTVDPIGSSLSHGRASVNLAPSEMRLMPLHLREANVGVQIEADAGALFVLLKNLVENALDFSPSGSDVKVLLDVNGLSVKDHGPGVPTDHRAQVFECFWRVPAQARPGSSLGLALVREIAQAHGWTVGCGEAPGGGAAFCGALGALSGSVGSIRVPQRWPRERDRWARSGS